MAGNKYVAYNIFVANMNSAEEWQGGDEIQ
jgi:hypothetical protein